MSLHFIVDGYNVIETHKELFPGTARKSRDRLLELIKVRRPEGSPRNKISIVFDGKPGVTSPPQQNMDVRFTKGREADWMIEQMVIKSKNPKQMRVITDDRGLQRKVTLQGAKTMGTVEFIEKLAYESPTAIRKTKKTLKMKEVEELNKELKEKWDIKDEP